MAKNAFTGLDDETDNPVRSIMSGAGDALLGDANSRRALLQIGLGLMQPQAMGQSTIGHIGQAIGGGGEAVGRIEAEEAARKKQEDAMDIAQGKLDVERQNAESYGKGMSLRGLVDRQALELERQKGRESLLGTRNYHDAAKEMFSAVNGVAADPNSEMYKRYGGKSIPALEKQLQEEAGGGATAAPATAGGGAVPPPEKRVSGQTYQTPKGPLKWNGNGWVTP